MWFKQVQLFELKNASKYTTETLIQKLDDLAFRPCLPSMQTSIGWVPPIDDDETPLVIAVNGCLMFCLQIEEKILPTTVIRHELNQKIKEIELQEDRKVRQREKLAMKDDLMLTLLPRAFTKFSRYYAYIDTKNNYLVFNTTQAKKTEQFISLFKKSVSEDIAAFELKKLSPIVTSWLKTQAYPAEFAIEKACVLQDPGHEDRVIRCQEQDLFATSIQALIKDGCEVKQLALSWHDRVNFILSADDFTLRSISYEEEITAQATEMEAETKTQQFIADFFIMSATITELLSDLQNVFARVMKKNVHEAEGMHA